MYDTLKQNNNFSRKYFYPLTADADCYAGRFSNDNIDVARDISKRVLVLPLYPELEDEVIEEIVRVIVSTQIPLA